MQTARHLDQLKPSYIREILAAATQPDVLSLAGGLPSDQHFPTDILALEFAKLGQQTSLFQYGNTQGYQPLIDHLSQHWQLADAHQCLITSGSQQGLDLIARAFLNPDDLVVMEAPSYLGALQVFQLSQASINTVEQTANGPDLQQLETQFARQPVKLFYAVPDFHNPTGRCWDLSTRQQVAELCQRYGVLLIEDAPYRELRFSGIELPMVSSFCPDQALVLRSFSKIAAPGLRLGAISGPTNWINSLIRLKQASDLHTALPLQAAILGLLQNSGFDKHLQQLRQVYQQRYLALTSALQTALPQLAQQPVQGGMFIWLELPPTIDDFALAERCINHKLAVVPGSVFYADQGHDQSALRLNFSNADETQLQQAAEILAAVINETQQRNADFRIEEVS